jgi:hypothetical protein
MQDKAIGSFSQFHDYVESFGRRVVVYRGQKNLEWGLTPGVGRIPLRSSQSEKEEKTMLRLFQEQALNNLSFIPENVYEWLAIAQHHGMPTRLLDWSRNPLIAAYFAVEEKYDGDSVVYAYRNNEYTDQNRFPDPFRITSVKRFIPRHVTSRITAQSGLFTIHPDPSEDSRNMEGVTKMIIRSSFRKKLKSILYKYGVHRSSLFPDLDGLSSHIRWLRSHEY